MMITSRHRDALVRGLMITLLAAVVAVTGQPVAADPGQHRTTYRNAVSDAFSDTYADPAVIQAKDGWWYVYATADPLYSGGEFGLMHAARTKNFANWEYLGTVFPDRAALPDYIADGALLWAPDIRYIAGRYVMYFTVTDTTLNPGGDPGIGVATSQSPAGPWTIEDEPIIAPRQRPGTADFLGTIDPAGFTDIDGQNYLYFGGYNGGFWGTTVSADGLTAESEPADYTQVAIDNRYEGGYVVRHDGWYYFMASTANCCAGPTTGYSVYTGRSRSPLGPFVDAEGQSLLDPYVGGTNLIMQNGNRWIGAGHHAIATDAEGRDWIVYHALDRNNAWLNQPFGINRRPTLIDPIDWIDGWPRTRAGAGPSDTARPAPVTTSALGIVADDPARSGVRGLRSGPRDAQSGATARLDGSAKTIMDAPRDRVRVRFDLAAARRSGSRPVTVSLGERNDRVDLIIDRASERLSVRTVVDGRVRISSDDLDLGPRWTSVVLEVDGDQVLAWATESDLSDPAAEVRVRRAGLDLAKAPVRFTGVGVLLDNLTVREPATEASELIDGPRAGDLLAADEFDSAALEDWTWVRENAGVTVEDGRLSWPLESSDLVGDGNTAGVLLQQPPTDEDWIVETKLDLDLGTDEVRNYQQAGLIAYRNDDDFARLSKVAIWNTRQVEYGRELVAHSDGRTSFGGSIQDRPGTGSTWLRLAYHRNAADEHQYRAAVSRDGEHWTWGGVWTISPGEAPRIGLIAHGGSSPAVNAEFDYLRWYDVD
jgi:hypothetical protein